MTRTRLAWPERISALALASALEQGSEHPVAVAIREAAVPSQPVQDRRNVPGAGMEGVVGGRLLRIGSQRFAAELARDADCGGVQADIWLADQERMLAGFELHDRLRPDAGSLVAALHRLGVQTILLSGDRETVVGETAHALSIPVWKAEVSPSEPMTLQDSASTPFGQTNSASITPRASSWFHARTSQRGRGSLVPVTIGSTYCESS